MKELTFLRIDYTLQLIIGVLMLVFLPFFFYGLMLLLPFGIWQNISSLTMVFIYKDRKRIPHLVFTAIWLSIYLLMQDVSWVSFGMGFFYIILLPACVGLWYFILTKKDHKLKQLEAEREYV